jgi:hypothetical protein
VFIATITNVSEKKQFVLEWTDLMNRNETLGDFANLFDKQMQRKVQTLSKCIVDFQKRFTSKEAKLGESIFTSVTKEDIDLFVRLSGAVTDVISATTQEKMNLFIKTQIPKR